jgi:hypothetical protein
MGPDREKDVFVFAAAGAVGEGTDSQEEEVAKKVR